MTDTTDDCIVLKIPRSIKGRWVAASRKAGVKLVPWAIDQIKAGTMDNYQPMELFADARNEPRADVVINCTKDFKEHYQQFARIHEKRMTDLMVNLVESNRLFW